MNSTQSRLAETWSGTLASAAASDTAGIVWQSIRAHALFLGMMAAYVSAMWIAILGIDGFRSGSYLSVFVMVIWKCFKLTFICVVVLRALRTMIFVRPESPISYLYHDVKSTLLNPRRWLMGAPATLALTTMVFVNQTFRTNIPLLNPYSWDVTFDTWDRALHFGSLPWQWLEPVLGNPVATAAMGLNYGMWFILSWGLTVWFGFAATFNQDRTRFIFTLLAAKILLGSVVAIMWSSVGPCYWTRFGLPGDPYGLLMAQLAAFDQIIPHGVMLIQDSLYLTTQQSASLGGITAMPSMHNSIAFLLALAAKRVNRTLGIVMWVHCIGVLIGSVWLGWHYAVDGYVAILVTYALWRLSEPVARWWHARPEVREFEAALDEKYPLAR